MNRAALAIVLLCVVGCSKPKDTRSFADQYTAYLAHYNEKVKPELERMDAELKPLLGTVLDVVSKYEVYGESYKENITIFGKDAGEFNKDNLEKLRDCKSKLADAKSDIKLLDDEKLFAQYSVQLESHFNKMNAMYDELVLAAEKESRTKELPPKPMQGKGAWQARAQDLKKRLAEAETGLKKLGI